AGAAQRRRRAEAHPGVRVVHQGQDRLALLGAGPPHDGGGGGAARYLAVPERRDQGGVCLAVAQAGGRQGGPDGLLDALVGGGGGGGEQHLDGPVPVVRGQDARRGRGQDGVVALFDGAQAIGGSAGDLGVGVAQRRLQQRHGQASGLDQVGRRLLADLEGVVPEVADEAGQALLLRRGQRPLAE